jgi:thiosulfate dehydrogenase [quinone] large subunit
MAGEPVSRRDRRQRVIRRDSYGTVEPPPRPAFPVRPAPGPSVRQQLAAAGPAALALLPLRFFFGLTFVYAGLDKLLDPAFLDAAAPGSIVAQLQGFTHVSPLAPLVRLAEPYAIPMGVLIALAEIAIGVGALSGLAFRLAAVGGALLSILFWLTASWTTTPYYYGADLPYAMGWLTLAIAGTGDLLVPAQVRELGRIPLDAWDRARLARAGGSAGTPASEVSPERRLLLQVGVLAGLSLAVASAAVPLRLFRRVTADDPGSADVAGGGDPSTVPTGAGTGSDGIPTPPPTAPGATNSPAFTPAGLTIASIATVDQHGAVRIRIPVDAPSPLPAGDPGIVVRLQDGSYACYDAVCTHEGCRVGWDAQDGVMLCPCHGAAFDPNDHGAVLAGPTNRPLPELPLVIDRQAGTITLRA